MHAFNVKTRPRRAVVRVKLVAAEPGEVRHHLEPIDIVGDGFELPPQADTIFTADFIAPFPIAVAMVSSHQHRFGTRVTVRPVVGGAEQAVVYEKPAGASRRWGGSIRRAASRPALACAFAASGTTAATRRCATARRRTTRCAT
jgi:hypothetical protein